MDKIKHPKGVNHPRSLLSNEQVNEIKALPKGRLPRGKNIIGELANRFGVTPHAIYDIRLGRSWQ